MIESDQKLLDSAGYFASRVLYTTNKGYMHDVDEDYPFGFWTHERYSRHYQRNGNVGLDNFLKNAKLYGCVTKEE